VGLTKLAKLENETYSLDFDIFHCEEKKGTVGVPKVTGRYSYGHYPTRGSERQNREIANKIT